MADFTYSRNNGSNYFMNDYLNHRHDDTITNPSSDTRKSNEIYIENTCSSGNRNTNFEYRGHNYVNYGASGERYLKNGNHVKHSDYGYREINKTDHDSNSNISKGEGGDVTYSRKTQTYSRNLSIDGISDIRGTNSHVTITHETLSPVRGSQFQDSSSSSSANNRLNRNRLYNFRQSGDIDDIIITCSRKLDTDPNNIKALHLRGSSYVKKTMYAEAIRDFTTIIQREYSNVDALYLRGVCYSKLGKPDSAIEDLSTVLDLNPDHVSASFARAACYNSLGQFSKAIEDYNVALLKDNSSQRSETRSDRRRLQYSGRSSPDTDSITTSASRRTVMSTPSTPTNRVKANSFESLESKNMASITNPYNKSNTNTDSNNGRIMPLLNNVSGPTETILSNESKSTRHTLNQINGPSLPKPLGSRRKPPPIPFTATQAISVNDYLSNHSSNQSSPKKTVSPVNLVTTKANGHPYMTVSNIDLSREDLTKAEEYHSRGFQYRRDGKFGFAIDQYSLAISINPHYFKAYFNRGFAYDKLGNYDQAISDYSNAIALDKTNAFAYYNRGISYDRINQLDLAYEDFTNAILLQRNNADFHHNRAFCLRKMNRLEEAIEDYTISLTIVPHHFKAIANRAYCYEKLGYYQEAVNDYNVVLEINAKHAPSLVSRACIYEKLNKYEMAINDFTLAIQYTMPNENEIVNLENITPIISGNITHQSMASLFIMRGKVYNKVGNYDEAINDFTNSLNMISHNNSSSIHDMKEEDIEMMIQAIFNRAMCFKALEAYQEAIEDFTYIINYDSDYVIAYMHRGYCYRKIDCYHESIQDYSRIIEIQPNNMRAYNNRAFSLAKVNRFEEAINDYNVVLHNDPSNAHAYHNRGISYDKIGHFDLAIADFSKVLELDSAETESDNQDTSVDDNQGGNISNSRPLDSFIRSNNSH